MSKNSAFKKLNDNRTLKIFFFISPFLLHFSAYSAQWFCKEGASSKTNNIYEVCGIGLEKTEQDSRKKALNNAFEEFDMVCNKSDDCRGKYKQISPLRTDCELNDNNYKCYRSFYIQIDTNKNAMRSEDDILSKELEQKEEKINSIQEKYGRIYVEKLRIKEEKNKIENELKNLKLQNLEIKNKLKEDQFFISQNKNLAEKLSEVEKLSLEIRRKIKNKNQIVENYLKRGMNLVEVSQILNGAKRVSLEGDDFFVFGTYKILFNNLENLDKSPLLEAVCDMNNNYRCINIEP